MLPLLIDEGLPASDVATALRAVRLEAAAVGEVTPRQSDDQTNVTWCAENGAALVTNDRGRKERVVLRLLAQHRVHALFVYNDLRAAPPHKLLYALLAAEQRMDDAVGRGLLHHKLKPTGRLEPRG